MAETILETIAAHARARVAAARERCPLEAMREQALARGADTGRPLAAALGKPGLSFLCEVKKASPSKGLISPTFPYLEIARDYAEAGADAISCLTEPKWFLGSDEVFRDIRASVPTPMLRKDFVVEEYQIYQARCMGADGVLLICALLDTAAIARYLELCEVLGMDALVEAHDGAEIASAAAAGARIIGVNNRDLKDFHVDFSNAARLRAQIPAGALYVAESGVRGPADVAALKALGADAVLMGEVLMRAADRRALLAQMREAAR